MNAHLILKKQRYKCRHCGGTFTLNTPIVNKYCFISNNTRLSIILDASKKISECDIAKSNNVSHSTVNRIINSSYEVHNPFHKELPENLCFDEFKSVKSAVGAMSFIYCNADTSDIFDIVEDRRLSSLYRYFMRFPQDSRDKVKRVVIDMYKPYMQLIKEVFPKAKIIIDKFHIVQLISRALNKTRITVMNQNKQNYTKLKRYWKLLLKYRADIDTGEYRRYLCYKQWMCEEDVLNDLLCIDSELNNTYELYQDLLRSIKTKNIAKFNRIIDDYKKGVYKNISGYMITSMATIISHQDMILNTLESTYHNGVIEGLINKIKVIKRIAFGYRSFYHFKARILMIQGLSKLKTA